jgi:hypothetical protein
MGGSSAPSAPPTPQSWGGQANYIPQYQQQADTAYNTNLQNSATAAQNLSQYAAPATLTAAQQIVNNPYAGQIVPAAQQAQQYAQSTVLPAEQAAAASLQSYGQQAMPYAQQALAAGFDPQNALYNQQYQRMLDQQNAINAMSGMSGSAYGAGLTGQAAQDFNTSWEANQQARQAAGAATAGSIENQAGQAMTGASQLGNQAIQGTVGAGQLPYAAANVAPAANLSALGMAGQTTQSVLAPAMNVQQSAGNYMGLGTNASQQYNNAVNANFADQMAAYNAQQAANSSMMGGIGSLGGQLFGAQGIFGGGQSGGAGSGLFSNGGLFSNTGAIANLFG